jgi:hypothetical protein
VQAVFQAAAAKAIAFGAVTFMVLLIYGSLLSGSRATLIDQMSKPVHPHGFVGK